MTARILTALFLLITLAAVPGPHTEPAALRSQLQFGAGFYRLLTSGEHVRYFWTDAGQLRLGEVRVVACAGSLINTETWTNRSGEWSLDERLLVGRDQAFNETDDRPRIHWASTCLVGAQSGSKAQVVGEIWLPAVGIGSQ